ncbi:MAG TPA: diguanylate cyclase [Candidatus Acidoferrum sp.]|nr:diguanylate cyclase [Candidatus Acidoferrum sp.]
MAHSASTVSQALTASAAVNNFPLAPAKTIRILLAGDATGEAAQALRSLFSPPNHALELTSVSSVTTLIPTLGVVNPEIILLDLAVTYPHPKETVRRVRRAAPNIPILMLADEAQKEAAKEALHEGAMDYVLREYMNDATLSRVFRGALERNTLEGLADFLRDPVSGLYTRDGLLTIGSSTLDLTRRNRGSLALFCILIHKLAALRETEGPAAADHAVADLTRVLASCFRRSDVLARIGDAQFAILAVDSTRAGAAIVRQRLERCLTVIPEQRESSRSLRFAVQGGLWTSEDAAAFPEFLDSVEVGLRATSEPAQVPS